MATIPTVHTIEDPLLRPFFMLRTDYYAAKTCQKGLALQWIDCGIAAAASWPCWGHLST